jgi:hypothetical protein
MEYPLKVLVFAAQVKAGMWKRNGYSVLHQVTAFFELSSCLESRRSWTEITDMSLGRGSYLWRGGSTMSNFDSLFFCFILF